MPNNYGVNERYMHSQRDPAWANIHLGPSTATMGGQGCLVTVCAYLASRTLGRDITPLEMIEWLNKNNGFNSNGELYWDKLRQFTGGQLRMYSQWNPVGRKYTARTVNYAGIRHFVVEMTNHVTAEPICYDPYAWPPAHPYDGFIKPLAYFKAGTLLGRFYFR
jgi:hypothetical protein